MFRTQGQGPQISAFGQLSRNPTCSQWQQSQHSESFGQPRYPQLFSKQKPVIRTNHTQTGTPSFNHGMPWLLDSIGRNRNLSQEVQPYIYEKEHEQSKYTTMFGDHQVCTRRNVYGTSGPTQKLNKLQLESNKNEVLRNINQPFTDKKYQALHGGIQFNNRKSFGKFSQSNSSSFSNSFAGKPKYKCSNNANNPTINCNKNTKHLIKYHDNASSKKEMLRQNRFFDSCEKVKLDMPGKSNACMNLSCSMEKDYVSNKSSCCIVTKEDQYKNREMDPEFKKKTVSNIKTSSSVLAARVIQEEMEAYLGASSEKPRSKGSNMSSLATSTDKNGLQCIEEDYILLNNREQNYVETDRIGESSLSKLSEQVKIKRSNGNGSHMPAEESNCTVSNINLEKENNTHASFSVIEEAVTLMGENSMQTNNPISYGMKDLHIRQSIHVNDRTSDSFVQDVDAKQNKTRLIHDELYKIGKCNNFEEKDTKKNDKENIIQQSVSPACSNKHTYFGVKMNGRSDTNEDTDKEENSKRSVCDENFLSRNNQVHRICNGEKVHQDNCTKPERFPFSPNQNINQQRSSKRVDFENDVKVIGKDGSLSIKMIDDSKPYRLSISLIEKRRKRIKQKQKNVHLKSDINLKGKLDMETKELIKLDKSASFLKGFRIPKRLKEGQLHNNSNVKLADIKNTSEQSKDLSVEQCHVLSLKSELVAKVLTSSGELTVSATDESIRQMKNEVPKYETVQRKRKQVEVLKVTSDAKVDRDDSINRKKIFKDRENTSNNTLITEESKEKIDRKVSRNHVLKVGGNQDSTQISDNSRSNKELEKKLHKDKLLTEKKYLSKKVTRPDKRNTLLQKVVKEKLSNLKKYSEFESNGDFQNVQRVEKVARLTEKDVEKALRALQVDRNLDTKNCVEKVSCSELKDVTAKQHRENDGNPLFSKMKTDQTVQNLSNQKMKRQYPNNLNTEENGYWKGSGASGKMDNEEKTDLRLKLHAARASRNKETSFKAIDMNKVEEQKQIGVKENLAGKLNSGDFHMFPGLKPAVSEKEIKAAGLKTVICSKIKMSDSNGCSNIHVMDKNKQCLENKTNANEANKCYQEHLSKPNSVSKSGTEIIKKTAKKGSLITSYPSCDILNHLDRDKAVCRRISVDDSSNDRPVNGKGTLTSDKRISKETMYYPVKKLIEKAHSSSRHLAEKSTAASNITTQLNMKFISKYGKKPCTEINSFQKKGNLLEKKSLGYTAPDIKRKLSTNNTDITQDTENDLLFENKDTCVKEKSDSHRNKNFKTVSKIVGKKVAELRKKSMPLTYTKLEYNIPVTTQQVENINKTYCNRSRLDGDKMTSHLLRADAVKQLNRNSEATESKLQHVSHSKDITKETAVGFPISVLNTRTQTIKTIENGCEIYDDEVNHVLGSKVELNAPYQCSGFKDFSLPEHNICKGNVKISDRTALYARNRPFDSESFSSDGKAPTSSELFCSSQTSAVQSTHGNSVDESGYGNKTQSSKKLNVSWEDIFAVPLHYFGMKSIIEGFDSSNSKERFNAYVKNIKTTQDDTYSSETWQNVNEVEMLQSVCNPPTSFNNYSTTSSDRTQGCSSNMLPSNGLLEEGLYTAYPAGRVPEFSYLAHENHIPVQTTNSCPYEGCNSTVQTGFTDSKEVLGHHKSELSITAYSQDSLSSGQSNVFEYNHGSFGNYGMEYNDLKSSCDFSNTHLYHNRTLNSRSYNKTQHNHSFKKKTRHRQIPSVRKSTHLSKGMQPSGWNPVIPFIDISFDETPASETSIYMQSFIVQHKSATSSNYDKTENKRHNSKDTVAVHPNVISQNNAADDCKLINTDMAKPVEQPESYSLCDIQSKLRDSDNAAIGLEVEKGLLSNLENENKCHSENEIPDFVNETTALPFDSSAHDLKKNFLQITNEPFSVLNSVKNEKIGGLQGVSSNCYSSVLRNETKICSDKSAKDKNAKATETILNEHTGEFTFVAVPPKALMTPKLSTDLVLPETPVSVFAYGPDNGSTRSKCSQQTCGMLNGSISDCKVDQNVKERIKYPVVKLSPLIITKNLEEMIDEYIAKNSTNMFNSTWIPLIQSPLWSVKSHSVSPRNSPVGSKKTPSISPRSTPKIAGSDLSPPVLSPVQLQKTCNKVLVEGRSMLKDIFSKKNKRKPKRSTDVLPSKNNEKSLFDTADTFVGKDFQTTTSRKRKKTKNAENKHVTKVEADIKRSKYHKCSKKATSGLKKSIMTNSTDTDKSSQTPEIKARMKTPPEESELDEEQKLIKPEYEQREEGNDSKEKETLNNVLLNKYDKVEDGEKNIEKCGKTKNAEKSKTKRSNTHSHSLKRAKENTRTDAVDEGKDFKIKSDEGKEDTTNKKCYSQPQTDHDERNDNLLHVTKSNGTKRKKHKKSISEPAIVKEDADKNKESECVNSVRSSKSVNNLTNEVVDSKENKTNMKCHSKQTDHAEKKDNLFTKSDGTKKKRQKKSLSEPVKMEKDADKNKKSGSVNSVISTKSINNLTNNTVVADADRTLASSTSEKKKKRKYHMDKEFRNINYSIDEKEKEKCSGDKVNSLTSFACEKDMSRKVTIKPSTLLESVHKDVENNCTSEAISVVSNGQNEEVLENTNKRRKTRSNVKTIRTVQQPDPKETAGIYQDRTENNHLTDVYIEAGTLTDTGKLKTKGNSETGSKEGLKILRKLKKKHENSKMTVVVDRKCTDSGQGLAGSNFVERIDKDTGMKNADRSSLEKFEAPVNVGKKKKKVNNKKDFENTQTPSKLPEVNTQKRKCKKKKPKKTCCTKVKHVPVTNMEQKNSVNDNKKPENSTKSPSMQDKSKLKAKVSEHLKAFASRKTTVPVKKDVRAGSKKLAKKGDFHLKCMICKRHFLTRRHLHAHTLSFHPHRCAWCNLEFNSKEESREHYFTHMKATYFCSTCNLKYGNLFTYKQHLRSKRHKKELRKNGDLKTDGQSVNDCDQLRADEVIAANQEYIPESENMADCLDQPGDTEAQFYSSLQHEGQNSWCKFKVFDNIVELQYNQPECQTFGNYGNTEMANQDMFVDFAHQNNAGFINSSALNETRFEHGYDYGMNVLDQNVMENTSAVVEDGRVYTDLTDVKMSKPRQMQYPLLHVTSSAVPEMTNEEFAKVDQDTDTTSLCRIANSFSLSSFCRENKD